MAELFAEKGLTVTQAKVTIGLVTYPAEVVTSVRLLPRPLSRGPQLAVLLGVGVAAVNTLNVAVGDEVGRAIGAVFLVLGVGLVVGGAVAHQRRVQTYAVLVGTPQGDRIALSTTDRDQAERAKVAIESVLR